MASPHSHSYNPSAPPLPDPSSSSPPGPDYNASTINSYSTSSTSSSHPPPSSFYQGQFQGYSRPYGDPSTQYSSSYGYGYGYGYGHPQQQTSFPPGTDPEVIRAFQAVDRDRSGVIDDSELQQALSWYQKFHLRTIRLLMFLFKNPQESSLRLGPKEFAALWKCLGEWRGVFERFDRDRSGRINATELRDAFYSLGYTVPPSVLQLLISLYDDGSRRKIELSYDSFIECGMVVKGLTEKFKEKDRSYTGSATLTYESFMTMVLPFLVTYN